MAKKKPKGPWMVVANDLLSGRVVYLTGSGQWAAEAGEAAVAHTDDEADYLLETGQAHEAGNQVVGPELISAGVEGEKPFPVRNREVIRATGPTVRTDLGYQAAN